MSAPRLPAPREPAAAAPSRPAPEAAEAPRSPVLRMQRAAGNAATQRLLGPRPGAAGRVQRWDSPEHVRIGDWAGGPESGLLTLAAHDADLPQRRQPVERWPAEWRRLYEQGSPDQRRVLREGLRYGEVVALTDAFSGGHVRTPRSQLMGSAPGNIRSKILHDLDNTHGVQVENDLGEMWVAYGDDMMGERGEDRNPNRDNLAIMLEAVRLSKQDVADALAAGGTGPAPDGDARFAAEELIPRAVDPSRDRWTGRVTRWQKTVSGSFPIPDDYTAMRSKVIADEGPDVVAGLVTEDDRVRAWIARHADALGRQPLEERARMGRVLLTGLVGDEDVRAVGALVSASRADRAALAAKLLPVARRVASPETKTRVLEMLGERR